MKKLIIEAQCFDSRMIFNPNPAIIVKLPPNPVTIGWAEWLILIFTMERISKNKSVNTHSINTRILENQGCLKLGTGVILKN